MVYAAVGGGLGAYTRRRRLVASARNALFASFGATAVAAIVLLNAFRTRDFSFAYVAEHSSKALPFPYVYTAFWGGQEGSLLLWLLVLTAVGSAAVAFNRRLTTEVLPWTVPVLGGVASFFALLLVFVASPFATQVAPADGAFRGAGFRLAPSKFLPVEYAPLRRKGLRAVKSPSFTARFFH